jgi:hypothetical protein
MMAHVKTNFLCLVRPEPRLSLISLFIYFFILSYKLTELNWNIKQQTVHDAASHESESYITQGHH